MADIHPLYLYDDEFETKFEKEMDLLVGWLHKPLSSSAKLLLLDSWLRALRELSHLLASLPNQREIDTAGLFAVWFGLVSHFTNKPKSNIGWGVYRAQAHMYTDTGIHMIK